VLRIEVKVPGGAERLPLFNDFADKVTVRRAAVPARHSRLARTGAGVNGGRDRWGWLVILHPSKNCWVLGTVLGRDEAAARQAAREKYSFFLRGREWAVRPVRL
jgi:hypothetical protein